MSTLSRRGLLSCVSAVAAAVPATLALASPALAEPTEADPVTALAENAIRLYRQHEATCEAITPFETKMIEWRKVNPAPDFSGRSDAVKCRDDGKGTIVFENLPTAEEYSAQTRARRNWRRRKLAAERRTGYREAAAAQTRACKALSVAIDTLIATRPRTLAGLATKARTARIVDPDGIDNWNFGNDIEALADAA